MEIPSKYISEVAEKLSRVLVSNPHTCVMVCALAQDVVTSYQLMLSLQQYCGRSCSVEDFKCLLRESSMSVNEIVGTRIVNRFKVKRAFREEMEFAAARWNQIPLTLLVQQVYPSRNGVKKTDMYFFTYHRGGSMEMRFFSSSFGPGASPICLEETGRRLTEARMIAERSICESSKMPR